MRYVMTGVLLLLAIPASVCSQERHFTIGVEQIRYLPYYGWEDGQYRGFAREALDLFAKYKGYRFSYQSRPIKRLYLEFLERRELDFKFPDSPDWKAAQRQGLELHYSGPVAEYIDGLMVLPENKGKKTAKALEQIGTVRGFTPWSYMDLIKAGSVRVTENSSPVGVLKQVLKQRIDGAYMNVAVAKHQLQEVLKSEQTLVFDPTLPHTKSSYLLSSIKHPEVVAEFTEFLRTHKEEVDILKQKYNIVSFDAIGR